MHRALLLWLFLFLISSNSSIAQNVYQSELTDLTDKLDLFEARLLSRKIWSIPIGKEILAMKEEIHRLGYETGEAGLKGKIEMEFADLVYMTADLGVIRLNLLERYLEYKSEFYKLNLDKARTMYFSMYLKVKSYDRRFK